jgi:hypothetical protein
VNEHERECSRCQATLRAASALRFKKLGKHERRQLLAAAPPDDEPTPIVPPGSSQSDQTATRRAITTLASVGLICVADGSRRVSDATDPQLLQKLNRKYVVQRFMWRTDLGDEIASEYSAELASPGQRIRWQARLERARDLALARCPDRIQEHET